MSNIIDSIQLSGVTYTLSAQTSGGDVSSAITSGDTNAVAGGAVYDKFDEVEQVTAAALNVLNESLSGKQDTLSAGTNITIVDNVISASGGGGVSSGEVQTMIDESISGKVSSVRLYDYKDSGSRYQVLQETKNGTSYTNICEFGKINDKAIVGTGATYFSLVETSAFTAHTADSVVHITAAERTAWNAKSDFSGSYNDLTNKLSAGTNITIVDNVISASGGGKAIEAGRGITVTTGTTADTVSLNLAIESGTGTASIAEGNLSQAIGNFSHAEGDNTVASGNRSHAEGSYTTASGQSSHAEGVNTETKNYAEHASGRFNVSSSASTSFGNSGNTLFSVGNGTSDNARHNAFEIRQDGSIFITSGGTDIKLQDHLGGGGGGTVDQTIISGSTNAVAGGAVYDKLDEVEQVTAAGLNALNDKFGGLKLQQITQSAYDQLQTKDPSTLYVIVN